MSSRFMLSSSLRRVYRAGALRQASHLGDNSAAMSTIARFWDEAIVPALVEYIRIPAKSPHFGWAKDGQVILQEVGIGPTRIDAVMGVSKAYRPARKPESSPSAAPAPAAMATPAPQAEPAVPAAMAAQADRCVIP